MIVRYVFTVVIMTKLKHTSHIYTQNVSSCYRLYPSSSGRDRHDCTITGADVLLFS